MRKTAQIDSLLNAIAAKLEKGEIPTLEESVKLEQLKWEYQEHANRQSLASELGLRIRVSSKHQSNQKYETISEIINYLMKQELPPRKTVCSAVKTMRAYTGKEITVKTLLGERYRKSRVFIPWQTWDFMGDFALRVLKNVKLNGKPLSAAKALYTPKDNNLFVFLEKLTEKKTDKYAHVHELIAEEAKCSKILKGFISRHTWENAYTQFKEKSKGGVRAL